jgi:hypothetical protein
VGGSFINYNLSPYNYFLKLGANGSVDSAVSSGVGVTNDAGGTTYQILPLTNGFEQFLIAGDFAYFNGTFATGLLRINPDATLDTSLSVGSGVGNNNVFAVQPANDGSTDYFMGGSFTTYNGTSVNGLVRITNGGGINNAFSVGSGFLGGNMVQAVLPDPAKSGSVYVGGPFTSFQGSSTNFPYFVKLTSTGSLDSTFTGMTTGFNGPVYAIVAVGDGTNDIYVGGSFTTYNGVAAKQLVRLTSTGAVSATFTSLGFTGGGPTVQALAIDGDGSGTVYVGGNFTKYNGVNAQYLIRLKGTGAADSGFGYGAYFNSQVNAVAMSNDGTNNVYVGGQFTTYNGTPAVRVTCLNSSGGTTGLVGTFTSGAGPNGTVYTIAPALDGTGDIFVGGNFSTYNNTTTDTAIRLHNTGALY